MNNSSFAEFISALRRERGLSQFQLGTLTGVSDKAVSKWESGAAMPRLRTLPKLAAALNVSLDELLACKYHSPALSGKGVFALKNQLWNGVWQTLLARYGDTPPFLILNRFETERLALQDCDAIVHFSALARIAQTARQEGYRITLRGEIGSSLIAWLMGITDTNPLPAHYHCPHCHQILFQPAVKDGWDLPPRRCACGSAMQRDGHNLPHEHFAASL